MKTALVSGGAKGIGKAICTSLASAGFNVVINYLNSEKEAKELEEKLSKEYHIRAISIKCDVSNESQVDDMFEIIEKEFGGIDILVNNAGIDLSCMFNEIKIDDIKKTLDVNTIGAYNLSRHCYKYMIDNKWGRIINIASTNGINTYYPMSLAYDASKAALISLTHNLSMQFSPYVTVNAIAPGFIGTENELQGYDKEFLEQEIDKIFVKRIGKPEDVANLVKFLVGDESSFINNTVIRIDGGQYGS